MIDILLTSGEVGFALGVFAKQPAFHLTKNLYEENLVCIADRNNAVFKKNLTLKQFVSASHILVKFRDEPPLAIEKYLSSHCMNWNVVASIPQLIKGSYFLAVIPKYAAKVLSKQFPIKYTRLPFDILAPKICLVWKHSVDKDPAHMWFRSLLERVFRLDGRNNFDSTFG